jgi:hypothetical protein
MDKFIAIVSCDSQSSSHGVREKLRKPTTIVGVGYTHSEQALIHSKLREWEKGEDLYFWKTYPKPLKFLKVEAHAHKSFIQELKYDKDNVARRLKNIPYTHFYYMTDNFLKITDGHNSQVLEVIPYDENIYGVITDIDTLDPQFVNREIYNKIQDNANNIIKMYFDSEGLTSDIYSFPKELHLSPKQNEFRIPNEVIDYNKFNYETGMVRGDSYSFEAKENFLHFDLVGK